GARGLAKAEVDQRAVVGVGERRIDDVDGDGGVERVDDDGVGAAGAGVAGSVGEGAVDRQSGGEGEGAVVGGDGCVGVGGVGSGGGGGEGGCGGGEGGRGLDVAFGEVGARGLAEAEVDQRAVVGVGERRIDDVDGDGGVERVDDDGVGAAGAGVAGSVGEGA